MQPNTAEYYVAIIIPVLIVFAAAVGATFYFYQRRDKYIDQNKLQVRHPHDPPQLPQSAGIENQGFKMGPVDKRSKVIQLAEFMETYSELRQVKPDFSSPPF